MENNCVLKKVTNWYENKAKKNYKEKCIILENLSWFKEIIKKIIKVVCLTILKNLQHIMKTKSF